MTEELPAYCAIAGLGNLPNTIASRSIIIDMRRRAPDEAVEPFAPGCPLPPLRASFVGAASFQNLKGRRSAGPHSPDARAAAREARQRFGAIYRGTRSPRSNREVPWALETFGEP
jgi:hypothetical protein